MAFWIIAEMTAKNGKKADFELAGRELSRETHKEPGMFGYTLAQEVKGAKDLTTRTNPDVYVMLEHYKDRDAFASHMKSAHFQKWGPKLMESMTSGPLKILAPAIAGKDLTTIVHHASVPGSFSLIAEFTVKPGKKEEFEKMMTELMTETHKEAGIIAYTLAQEVKGSKDLNNKVQPDKYYMIEHYKSLDAFIFHVKTPHFKKFGPKLGEYTNPGPAKFYSPVFPFGSKL